MSKQHPHYHHSQRQRRDTTGPHHRQTATRERYAAIQRLAREDGIRVAGNWIEALAARGEFQADVPALIELDGPWTGYALRRLLELRARDAGALGDADYEQWYGANFCMGFDTAAIQYTTPGPDSYTREFTAEEYKAITQGPLLSAEQVASAWAKYRAGRWEKARALWEMHLQESQQESQGEESTSDGHH